MIAQFLCILILCVLMCRCGSYDHVLYGLNHELQSCVCKVSCGGSIYASPCIDLLKDMLYVGSTRGLLTAVKLEVFQFFNLYLPCFSKRSNISDIWSK
jgi:hypothetical protein